MRPLPSSPQLIPTIAVNILVSPFCVYLALAAYVKIETLHVDIPALTFAEERRVLAEKRTDGP